MRRRAQLEKWGAAGEIDRCFPRDKFLVGRDPANHARRRRLGGRPGQAARAGGGGARPGFNRNMGSARCGAPGLGGGRRRGGVCGVAFPYVRRGVPVAVG